MERQQLPAVLRQPRVRPQYRVPEPGANAWRRIFTSIGDAQSWLDLVHGIFKIIGASTPARIGLNTAVGVFFLIILPIVVRGCAQTARLTDRPAVSRDGPGGPPR